MFTVLDYKLLIQVLLQNIRKRAAGASTQRRDREKVCEREISVEDSFGYQVSYKMWTRTNYMSDIKKRTPPMLQRQYWHSRSDTHTLAHSLTHTHSLSLSHIHTHKHTHDNIIIAWHIKLILMALRQSPFKAILILSLSISF